MTELLELWAAPDRFTTGRPAPPDRIVLHTTTTTFDGAIAIFRGGSRMVSAHFVVDKEVDRIARCVNENDTAWHCGNWPMNQRSIGVEHVDDGDWNGPRPDGLYERSAHLVYLLCFAYAIPINRTTIIAKSEILRHNEIVATACPDALDVDRIVRRAKEYEMAFDPRNNQADKDWLDNRVRELIMGEPALTGNALRKALSAYGIVKAPARGKASTLTKRSINKPTKAAVRMGHGRG